MKHQPKKRREVWVMERDGAPLGPVVLEEPPARLTALGEWVPYIPAPTKKRKAKR